MLFTAREKLRLKVFPLALYDAKVLHGPLRLTPYTVSTEDQFTCCSYLSFKRNNEQTLILKGSIKGS